MQLPRLYQVIQDKINSPKILPYLLTIPVLIVLLILLIYTMFYLFYLSIGQSHFPYITLTRIKSFITSSIFLISSMISLKYIVATTCGTLVLGFLISLLLNSVHRGSYIFYVVFIIPLAVAPVVTAKTWVMILNPLYGILNYLLAHLGVPPQEWIDSAKLALPSLVIVTIWRWTPLVILILYAGLQTLPLEPREAALIDGAGKWQILLYVTIPLLKPIMAITILLQFITCFKEFDIVYGLTKGGPAESTETLVLRTFLEGFRFMDLERAAVIAVFLMIIALLITNPAYKILVRQH